MLARGELRAVGATTLDEYKKHVEKDAALERRFQPIYVGEPTPRGHDRDPARPQGALRGPPRRHDHRRRAGRRRDPERPLHRRPLPPRQGDRPRRRGRLAASRSSSPPSPPRSTRSSAGSSSSRSRWSPSARTRPRPRARRRSSASSSTCASRRPACAPSGSARRSRPRATASCASASTRPAASSSAPSASSTTSAPPSCATARSRTSRQRLQDAENRPEETYEPPVYLSERVDVEEIAEVVGKWTGIPVSRLVEGEVEKLIHMEERLHQRVIGQDEAVEAVSDALRRSRAGPQRPRPPDRHVPVPRPDRRRQDRAGPRAGGVHVRLPGRDGPHRHVRVHGEALGRAARRRASRLRRLRGGRPAHRGGAPAPVLASSCSTRSRRPTTTSSTSCCRCWTTAASPTARAAPWTSRTRS